MSDHDYGKITADNTGEYFRKDARNKSCCLHCGMWEGYTHGRLCLVPLVLELKDKLERKDRALQTIVLEAGDGEDKLRDLATEALK